MDRFLAAKIEAAGLQTGPPADRRTLIRRLSFVLTGLPPAADDVEAFVRDDSPEAYAGLVDRLLASPQFGECWARHWMDVVRFGETHGVEWNFEIGGAWQYRDYLIRAFNVDVPFDQLVREHVAGDLLPRPRLNPCLGLNESTIGPAFLQFGAVGHDDCYQFPELALEIIDNQIDVVSKAFQATTVSCARCHDHKIDAVSAPRLLRSARHPEQLVFCLPPDRYPGAGRDAQQRWTRSQPRLKKVLAEIWQRDLGQLPTACSRPPRSRRTRRKRLTKQPPRPAKKEPATKPAGKPADAWADEGHLWQRAPRRSPTINSRPAGRHSQRTRAAERQKRSGNMDRPALGTAGQPWPASRSPSNLSPDNAPWQARGTGPRGRPVRERLPANGDRWRCRYCLGARLRILLRPLLTTFPRGLATAAFAIVDRQNAYQPADRRRRLGRASACAR